MFARLCLFVGVMVVVDTDFRTAKEILVSLRACSSGVSGASSNTFDTQRLSFAYDYEASNVA